MPSLDVFERHNLRGRDAGAPAPWGDDARQMKRALEWLIRAGRGNWNEFFDSAIWDEMPFGPAAGGDGTARNGNAKDFVRLLVRYSNDDFERARELLRTGLGRLKMSAQMSSCTSPHLSAGLRSGDQRGV